jgi:hypothetical protein
VRHAELRNPSPFFFSQSHFWSSKYVFVVADDEIRADPSGVDPSTVRGNAPSDA